MQTKKMNGKMKLIWKMEDREKIEEDESRWELEQSEYTIYMNEIVNEQI